MKKIFLIFILSFSFYISNSQLPIECGVTYNFGNDFCLGDTVKLWNKCGTILDSTIWFIGTDLTKLVKYRKDTVDYIVTDTSQFINGKWQNSYVFSDIYYKDKSIGIKFNNLFTHFLVCPITNSDFTASKRKICEGEQIDFYDLSNRAPNFHLWTFEGADTPISSEKNPKGIRYAQQGKYKVRLEVANSQGKKISEKIEYIEVLPKRPDIKDTVTIFNTFVGSTIQMESCVKGDKYEWHPKDGLSCNNCDIVTLNVKQPITYTCISKSNSYCDFECKYIINADSLSTVFIPNIFTPDDDGINDEIEVFGRNIEFIQFSIFDRFGNFIFSSNNINEKWNGTFRGEPVLSGVFTYTFEYLNQIDNKKYFQNGSIALIRR